MNEMRAALVFFLLAAANVAAALVNECSDHSEDPSTCAEDNGGASRSSPSLDPTVKQWILDLNTDSSYIDGVWIRHGVDGSEDIRVIDPSTGKKREGYNMHSIYDDMTSSTSLFPTNSPRQ